MPGGVMAGIGGLLLLGLFFLFLRSLDKNGNAAKELTIARTALNEIDELVDDNYNYLDIPGQSLADSIRGKIKKYRKEIS